VKQLALLEYPVEPGRITELIVEMGEAKHLFIQPGYGDLQEQHICHTPAFYHTEVALLHVLPPLPVTLTRFWGVGEEKFDTIESGGFDGQISTNLHKRIQAASCSFV